MEVAMSLRGGREPKPSAAKPMMSFRCSPELKTYIREAAAQPGRDQTEVISSALELDRDLAQLLAPDVARIHAYAEQLGLKVGPDLPRVLAELVRLGLDAIEKRSRSRK